MGKKTINSLRKSLQRSSEDRDENEDERSDQVNDETERNHGVVNEEKQGNENEEIEEEKNENTKRKRVRKRKASNVDGNQETGQDEQESKITKIQSNDESRYLNPPS